MATIREFKAWLDRFSEDTIIEIGIQQRAGNFEAYGPIQFETIDFEDNDFGKGWEFVDFTNNKFVKETDKHFNKKYLRLGEQN